MRTEFDTIAADNVRTVIRCQAAPFQTTIPVPIEDLAQQWEVPVFDAPRVARYEGLTVWDGDQPVVFINRRRPQSAQRFALAHEIIGHIWLHAAHMRSTSAIQWMRDPLYRYWEVEANTAAAEFLLPYDWMVEEASARWHNGPLGTAEFARWIESPDAALWARQAGVSRAALGHHLCDLGMVAEDGRAYLPSSPRPNSGVASEENPVMS